ncbi:hypothetical protein [Sphingobium sp. CECT 9361]|uniref:hypothetical protein n=1 Tax=Sphingobium sp. CECT 9361 TaxID=2845384 RepID=UPI001E3403FE|nr:hypothetical protein [Sphingobium sp. CECT 9361]CAH0354432.1 hypothetical protein SPH9361_03021 [Sphingobium sp. CECT 9361]
MEHHEKDPAITRAMALALMRQAQNLLQGVREEASVTQLQRAIDTLLRKRPDQAPGAS